MRICNSVITCNEIKIKGHNIVCDTASSYTARKNAGCILPVNWSVRKQDSAFVTIKPINDSVVNLVFSKNGDYSLTATIYTTCDTIIDALPIHVNASAQPIKLGRDTTLCTGDSLKLHAGPGFKNYTWQDGTGDSVYLVKKAGRYYVSVTGYCNNIYSDTIRISTVNAQRLAIVPDTLKCFPDTMVFKLPPVFKNINVSPAGNVIISNNSIAFYTTQTQGYTISASDVNGCKTSTSIAIRVIPQAHIDIGRDTDICAGDSLILNAGNSFARYTWSNGDTLQQIIAKRAGIYAVAAYTTDGCVAKDSITVQLHSLPITGLNKIDAICNNTTKRLSAKSGYAAYLWNDGSSKDYLNISATGKYWIQVTDANGCVNSDTTVVGRLLPIPAGFLPADTVLCNYEQIVLKPTADFKSYVWSNGSTQNNITIVDAGTYLLTVTSFDGCVGTDTIKIAPKQCMEGFYIPNAFTPNGDNVNDIFRPWLFGNVASYRFTVFNRWGTKIYETTQLAQGWDGTANGLLQDTGTFIWYCTYQIAGQPVQFKKGTFVLLK